MMTDDSLHLQVKTIETELSRAQSCLARGDVHACQLHILLALSSFLSAMGAIHNVPIGAYGCKPVTIPELPEPQPPVRQSLRWEHVPDDFGGKMCLFVGGFDIIGIQQDEDDNERAFYYPTTGWYHLENVIGHWPSQYANRVAQIDQLMRTPEQAMRWTEEQLKLPILPTWLNGEQVTLEAAPEPQEPVWHESPHQPEFWVLEVGAHYIGAIGMANSGQWFIDGLPQTKPYTFDGARAFIEGLNGLRPCRVIR